MGASQGHPFDAILSKIRKESKSKVELGTKFEVITKDFLETDTQYKKRFSRVDLWKLWKYNDGHDTGIDLMATQRNGDWCAIQCKCYADDGSLDLNTVSTFFAKATSLAKKHRKTIHTILVYTGDYITPHAEKVITDQRCHIIEQENFKDSSIIWDKFPKIRAKKPKTMRLHQINAFNDVISKLETSDRGKMIMACGTGKTLTSLRIAEKHAGVGKTVLYLVPSISLIHQTMREWSENALINHYYTVVCSDKTVDEEGSITELAFPPTTNVKDLQESLANRPTNTMGVIFSTYHSIEVVSKAMKNKQFDLVLCDEAHRTTGVEDASYFTKVHSEKNISSKRRIYMTATPRVYSEAVKNGKVEVHSMDDEETYGKDMHYYSFSDAIDDKQLTDFKVRIPVIPEEDLAQYVQEGMDGENEDGTIDERVLLAAVWHGLNYNDKEQMPLLQRAIAFSNRIESSRQFAGTYVGKTPTQDEINYAESLKKDEDEDQIRQDRSFKNTVQKYENNKRKHTGNTVSVRHVDGKMRAHVRNVKMRWLKDSNYASNECRILSNARCLSEGVDVPDLDGVIFLHPRKSKVDVIQSVGRVMRKADGKKWGYVILPVVVPAGRSLEESLNKTKAWKAVWQVLVALRSHDPNFANVINRINLESGSGTSPSIPNIEIIWMGSLSDKPLPESFGKIVTKMVEKVGDREYFDDRSKELGEKARDIRGMLKIMHDKKYPKVTDTVSTLQKSLKTLINDSITENTVIDVIAQHYTLSYVFNALFEEKFRSNNPVAMVLDDAIKNIGLIQELKKFDDYYDDVRKEAKKFETIHGKQNYIKKIYGNFLMGFDKKGTEQHGIVYTPIEVIDFIIHSVEHVLRTEFNTGFNRNNVKVFDPFVGTGTFITQLLESGLIKQSHLEGKYRNDLYANEMSLLAYYVAMINIESVFGKISEKHEIKKHIPFSNINYTDTLNHDPRYRIDASHRSKFAKFGGDMDKIQDRVQRTNWSHIHVIFGNPPYSVGQRNYNDQNENIKYPELDKRIKNTYGRKTKSSAQNALYDSYVRSLRWASDRIGNSGVIAFITNASFIRSNTATGIRACLTEEFTDVWCFDLRGNGMITGDGRSIFEYPGKSTGGTRTPVTIIILIKNPKKKDCKIHYYALEDKFHSGKDKRNKVKQLKSIKGIDDWTEIIPDIHHDWVEQRNEGFYKYDAMGDKDTKAGKNNNAVFKLYSMGLATSRDVWAYNSSKDTLSKNMKRHIDYCNNQDLDKNTFDSSQAKWTPELIEKLKKIKPREFKQNQIRISLYRPFFKQFLYFDNIFNHRMFQIPKIFPKGDSENIVICISDKGKSGMFSTIVTDITPDLHIIEQSQCFPLLKYENNVERERERANASKISSSSYHTNTQDTPPHLSQILPPTSKSSITDSASHSTTTKRVAGGENILDSTLQEYQTHYSDKEITKKDIFYYIYGLLHHSGYKKKFANSLSREMPRIPMAPDFRKFSEAGQALAYLHLNYERCQKYKIEPKSKFGKLEKMSFPKIKKDGKSVTDKTKLKINGIIAFEGIPEIAYQVNKRTPLEWVIDRYRFTTDGDSGITNDPTADMTEKKTTEMIQRLIYVSVESDKIISKLSKLEFEPKDWTPKPIGLDSFSKPKKFQSKI